MDKQSPFPGADDRAAATNQGPEISQEMANPAATPGSSQSGTLAAEQSSLMAGGHLGSEPKPVWGPKVTPVGGLEGQPLGTTTGNIPEGQTGTGGGIDSAGENPVGSTQNATPGAATPRLRALEPQDLYSQETD
jgi:hypothetical protein